LKINIKKRKGASASDKDALVETRLFGRVLAELFIRVLVVHIVADSNEFL
jgi:hypothetical protein